MKEEYKQTWFRCEQETLPQTFAIITAYNPGGIQQDHPTTNELQYRELTIRLESLGYSYFPLLAGSKDFSHVEPSFGVSIPQAQAIKLALEFNQDAIFWIENGAIYLVECQTHSSETIAPWADRLLPR